MRSELNSSRILRILTGVFAVIYLLLFIIEPLVGGEHAEFTLNVFLVYILFLNKYLELNDVKSSSIRKTDSFFRLTDKQSNFYAEIYNSQHKNFHNTGQHIF